MFPIDIDSGMTGSSCPLCMLSERKPMHVYACGCTSTQGHRHSIAYLAWRDVKEGKTVRRSSAVPGEPIIIKKCDMSVTR